MTDEEKFLETVKNITIMKSDLFFCLGMLRSMGNPAEAIEKRWGVTK